MAMVMETDIYLLMAGTMAMEMAISLHMVEGMELKQFMDKVGSMGQRQGNTEER